MEIGHTAHQDRPPRGIRVQLQRCPPGDPDENDGKILAADHGAKQAGKDGQDKTRQGDGARNKKRPAGVDQRVLALTASQRGGHNLPAHWFT